MSFILREDFAADIADNLLDDITEVDDDKIQVQAKKAIEFMASFLNSRYDVDAIFTATGSNRNPLILGFAKDITLYYLHRLVNWRNAPAARVNAYNEAKDWLEKVAELQINPRDLPVLQDGSKDYIMYGSRTPRTNHI